MWTCVKGRRKHWNRVEANRRSLKVEPSSTRKNWIYHSNWTLNLVEWWRKNASIIGIRRVFSLCWWIWIIPKGVKY